MFCEYVMHGLSHDVYICVLCPQAVSEMCVLRAAPDTWYEVHLWAYNKDGDGAATIGSKRTPKSDGSSS